VKKQQTNWDRYFAKKMEKPELRALVQEELKALELGVQLARLRERRHLTQMQLAERSGIGVPNISRIENDPAGNLTMGTLCRLAGAMGFGVDIRFQPRRAYAKKKYKK
jgi:DNA-binding Xre family transcriptional regulator